MKSLYTANYDPAMFDSEMFKMSERLETESIQEKVIEHENKQIFSQLVELWSIGIPNGYLVVLERPMEPYPLDVRMNHVRIFERQLEKYCYRATVLAVKLGGL